jgi:hypothetical protein
MWSYRSMIGWITIGGTVDTQKVYNVTRYCLLWGETSSHGLFNCNSSLMVQVKEMSRSIWALTVARCWWSLRSLQTMLTNGRKWVKIFTVTIVLICSLEIMVLSVFLLFILVLGHRYCFKGICTDVCQALQMDQCGRLWKKEDVWYVVYDTVMIFIFSVRCLLPKSHMHKQKDRTACQGSPGLQSIRIQKYEAFLDLMNPT